MRLEDIKSIILLIKTFEFISWIQSEILHLVFTLSQFAVFNPPDQHPSKGSVSVLNSKTLSTKSCFLTWDRCEGHQNTRLSVMSSTNNEKLNLLWPPGMKVGTHHQMFSMVAWWNTCRNEIWFSFFRRTINTVSSSSMTFENPYHHSTLAIYNISHTLIYFLQQKTVFFSSFLNSFNKTEAAVFSCRLCFLRAFPFISLILHNSCMATCIVQ